MSNAAKWSRSWAGVTMPAWWVPRKGYVVARGGASTPPRSAYASPTLKPAASPATAAPPPTRPRRETFIPWSSGQDRGRQVRQRLGQGVDGIGEALHLGAAEIGVEPVAVALALVVQEPVDGGEARRQGPPQRRVTVRQDRLDVLERDLGALHVGGEVPQVGVRPVLLLAGDLARGDLLHQTGGAVGDLVGGAGEGADLV